MSQTRVFLGPSLLSKMRKTKKLMENAMVQLQEIFFNLIGVLGIKMCMKVVQATE